MKKTVVTEYRVVIIPDEPMYKKDHPKYHEAYKKNCLEIALSAKRHLDGIKSADYEMTTQDICSHCGYTWEEDESTGEPQCCNKAQEEWAEEKVNSIIKEATNHP